MRRMIIRIRPSSTLELRAYTSTWKCLNSTNSMKSILASILFISLAGCCSSTSEQLSLELKTPNVYVPPTYGPLSTSDIFVNTPLLEDQYIYVDYVTKDTLEADSLRKYIKRLKGIFMGGRKPDSVRYVYIDTTLHIHELPAKPSWLEKQMGNIAILAGCLIAFIIIVRKALDA